jgi:predicted metal-dependent phosphoesterase TrpH
MKRSIYILAVILLFLTACDDILLNYFHKFYPPPPPETPVYQGVTMNFYYGNLHSHTEYSDGQGTPDQALSWAKTQFDFYAITDHAEQLTSTEWITTGNAVNDHSSDGNFIAIRGFEWTHPTFGHINVLNTSSYTSTLHTYDPDDFYAWIYQNNGLAHFNHPGREVVKFSNFKYKQNLFDNFYGIETGNKSDNNASNIYAKYYSPALNRGWHLAPLQSQDNHFLGANNARTVIITQSLTRNNIIDAIRKRRLYSSDDTNIKLTFKYNDFWMGSTIHVSEGPVTLYVRVTDDVSDPVNKIELIDKSGDVIEALHVTNWTGFVEWTPAVTISDSEYYYVKVYENNGNEIVYSSPLWFYINN